MSTPFKLVRIPSLKTAADFRAHLASLNLELGFDEEILTGEASPLRQPISWGTRTIGNRWAIHPMEGWDGTTTGGVTEPMIRRWQRFGESGAKLIWGGEAMAVRPDGRANPNQLILNEENKTGIAQLRETLITAHQEKFGRTDDLVIGFQLTHSGRFCRPHDKKRWESRIAYHHPILDQKFNVTSKDQVLTDDQIRDLIQAYLAAAKIAAEIGAGLDPILMAQLVTQIGTWAYYSGVRRLFLVNAHVTNAAPLRCALESLRAAHDDLMVANIDTATMSARVRQAHFADANDWHANEAETALMMAVAPQIVRMAKVAEADDEDRTIASVFAHPVNRTSRNGVTGFPSRATRGAGEHLYGWMVEDLVSIVTRGLAEVPPLPQSYTQRATAPATETAS